MTKTCLRCGKVIEKLSSYSKKYWQTRRFCSIRCSKLGTHRTLEVCKKTRSSLKKFWKTHPEANKKKSIYMKSHPNSGMIHRGQHLSSRTEFVKGAIANERHPFWKGDKVGYVALHVWVHRHWGKAYHCEKNETHINRKYEWANIGHTYKRKRDDWIQLCQECHRELDRRRKKESVIYL